MYTINNNIIYTLHSHSNLINFHFSTLVFNIHVLELYDTSVFLGSFGLCWNLYESSRAGRSLSRGATQQSPLETELQELTVHWHCYLIFPTSASVEERITEQNLKSTIKVSSLFLLFSVCLDQQRRPRCHWQRPPLSSLLCCVVGHLYLFCNFLHTFL